VKLGVILIDTKLRKIVNLKEVCHDFDFPPRFAKMSTFFKAVQVEVCKLVGQMRRHVEKKFVMKMRKTVGKVAE
jgi:hypothetical protein